MSNSTPLRAPTGSSGSTIQAAVIELGVLVDYISATFQMTASTLLPARQRALALWRQHPRELAALCALALAGAIAAGGVAWSTPNLEQIGAARAEQTAPEPPPLLIRNIAPDQATTTRSTWP